MDANNVLVVAAHGDDEVLGVGGAIASHAADGDSVTVLILSVSDQSRADAARHGAPARRASAEAAADLLGVRSLVLHDLPDNRFDTVDQLWIVKLIEDAVRVYSPKIVYTHHSGDVSTDHRCTFNAVLTATRPQPGQSVRELATFEIRSSTDWQFDGSPSRTFTPNYWIELDERIVACKLDALAAYSQEMHAFPHSRSVDAVRALLAHRGAQVGVHAAEAFYTARRVARV